MIQCYYDKLDTEQWFIDRDLILNREAFEWLNISYNTISCICYHVRIIKVDPTTFLNGCRMLTAAVKLVPGAKDLTRHLVHGAHTDDAPALARPCV